MNVLMLLFIILSLIIVPIIFYVLLGKEEFQKRWQNEFMRFLICLISAYYTLIVILLIQKL